METTIQTIVKNNDSVLLNIDKISQHVKQEDMQVLVDAINKEMGCLELEKNEIEQLQEIMSVDAMKAANWKNVADVLKYVSVFALAENNPDAMKKITEVLLGIVGIFFPIANTAQGVLAKVPDRVFSGLIKIGGFVSPDYLIYRGVNKIANTKSEKAKTQAENEAIEGENMVTLIIVCKNKLLSAEMNHLINLKDDVDDMIVGTKDGTIHPIIWNESAWEAFRDKLTSNDRVLIIGKIKNTMPLTWEQTRFDKYGVKYGWNNNIALVEATPKALKKGKDYNEFLSELNGMQVSDKSKKNVKFKFNWLTVGKLAVFPPLLIGDALRESPAIREQQLLYGLHTLYMKDLSEFLASKESDEIL